MTIGLVSRAICLFVLLSTVCAVLMDVGGAGLGIMGTAIFFTGTALAPLRTAQEAVRG